MVFGLMTFIAGLFVGLITMAAWRTGGGLKHRFSKVYKRTKALILPVSLISGVVFLIITNEGAFFHPAPVGNIHNLENRFLSIPANITILYLGGFIAIVGLLSFVIRLPFSNWQQIKLFGIEATRIKAEAEAELKANRELDFNRIFRLGVLSNHEKGYEFILKTIQEDGKVVVENLLHPLIQSLIQAYKGSAFNLNVSGNFVPSSKIFLDAPRGVKDIWATFQRENTAHCSSNGWESWLVCPIQLGPQKYVLWLRSEEYQFSASDESFVEGMRNILEHHVALAYIDTKEMPEVI